MLPFVPPSEPKETMARKSSTARTPRSSPAKRPSRVAVVAFAAVRFSRPRSLTEGLAFVLAAVGLISASSAAGWWLFGNGTKGTGVAWCVVLFAAATLARFWSPLHARLHDLTPERGAIVLGLGLLVIAAGIIALHVVIRAIGLSDAYPPFGSAPRAIVYLGLLALVGAAFLLRLPVHWWLIDLAKRVATSAYGLSERRVVQSAEVASSFVPVEVDDPAEDPAPDIMSTPAVPAPLKRQQQAQMPPLDVFAAPPRAQTRPNDLEHKSQRIEETLASFGVKARVVGHHCGPVVTQFDVQPERGVKVKSITALQNDLALALAAPTIRIQAPVPGKPVVGIEIPNSAASVVSLRELLESPAYRSSAAPLAIALGKDVAGAPSVIDLAKMPHLLIAGATGSGKSVAINALISCLLYRNSPEAVRLMMIDPKMVELAVYNGVPHLLSPVVTQMDKVVGVLQWALREMERRYQLFADSAVRNIGRYNEKMAGEGRASLPYIVLVVDELADLMMVAPEDVEEAICRLAQLARAAGIHLVIATQRPSVDVITGLIKANFPARIAFAMTSQVDSRTILDTAGAEKLLGRGDMLYQPPDAPARVRLQGAHVSDREIEQLVEFWKRAPLAGAIQIVPEEEFKAAEKAAASVEDDLLAEATRVVREHQHASVSYLQRSLRIGYSRAARLMDELEARGVVGPADGSKQRPVLDRGQTAGS